LIEAHRERRSNRRARPRDAASLVLIRGAGERTAVLLGRRRPEARFMPGFYVFPGGRLEPADERAASRAVGDLRSDVLARLARHCSAPRARAFAHAALRETVEETGLAAAAGEILRTLDYIARALTPPTLGTRYDTRFFLADGALFAGELKRDGELSDLGWRHLGEVEALPMARVTRFVLNEAARVWVNPPAPDPHRLAPFLTGTVEHRRVIYE
jgi:8-oxo-dGTP pyrophosphatase MutT (NUDIX family)